MTDRLLLFASKASSGLPASSLMPSHVAPQIGYDLRVPDFNKSKSQLSVCLAPNRFGDLGDDPLTNPFRSGGILIPATFGYT